MQKTFRSDAVGEGQDFDEMANQWERENRDRIRIVHRAMSVAQARTQRPLIVTTLFYEEIGQNEG